MSTKLVVQIPCWNEEASIGEAVNSLPKEMSGVDSVEVIVVDDGSTDRSVDVAMAAGATEVVRLPRHCGLAAAFSHGVAAALRRGADILVNTDADLQYPSHHIADLLRPILAGDADIVVGNRLAGRDHHFSRVKFWLERFGSLVVRVLSGVPVKDAASGFRAYNRDAMETVFIRGRYSYTLESLIQAGMQGLRIANVPISTNASRRRSRLVRSIPSYMTRSSVAIVRAYLMYHPLRFFVALGGVFMVSAGWLGARFLVNYVNGHGAGHVQSLILLAVLAIMGFQCIVLGLIGDLLAANRVLLEGLRRTHLARNSEGRSETAEPFANSMTRAVL